MSYCAFYPLVWLKILENLFFFNTLSFLLQTENVDAQQQMANAEHPTVLICWRDEVHVSAPSKRASLRTTLILPCCPKASIFSVLFCSSLIQQPPETLAWWTKQWRCAPQTAPSNFTMNIVARTLVTTGANVTMWLLPWAWRFASLLSFPTYWLWEPSLKTAVFIFPSTTCWQIWLWLTFFQVTMHFICFSYDICSCETEECVG